MLPEPALARTTSTEARCQAATRLLQFKNAVQAIACCRVTPGWAPPPMCSEARPGPAARPDPGPS
eukprot:754856-Hanusia_phi.AAC.6